MQHKSTLGAFARLRANAFLTLFLIAAGLPGLANSQLVSTASNDAYANNDTLRFNYAEALQKADYFLQAQQNGTLSPNNRVAWRGNANLTDGSDISKDLAGGLFDAGDHWTSNQTMAFLTTTLAWSAIEKPSGWTGPGQMDELLETLVHVNNYFIKCVLNPTVSNPAQNLDIVVGCGGRDGVPSPNVHSIWAGGEMANAIDLTTGQTFTNRPTFRLNSTAPGGDVPGAMASAMASSSMVIRNYGYLLAGKNGFANFNPATYADQLYDLAGKLAQFANANMGAANRNAALRSDGQIVDIGYRGNPIAQAFTAMTWLARATSDATVRQSWVNLAEQIYDGPYKAEALDDWYQDYGWGNMGKLGAYNMVRLFPTSTKYHNEVQYYATRFLSYGQTPGGLRLRDNNNMEYGSLRHSNNAAVIALYYSDLVDNAPVLPGNTWWKYGASNATLKAEFIKAAKRCTDYALGANPYGRSYVIGFGNQPFNNPHHRGAHGVWNGFDHFNSSNPSYNPDTSRNILYGAMIAGPDNHDVFLCGDNNHSWQQVPGTTDYDTYYLFPNRRNTPVRKTTYVFDPADQPEEVIIDSKYNEVALDYNAGFMANLAWLNSNGYSNGSPIPDTQFPPALVRNESLDPWTTDREMLVTATITEDSSSAIQLNGTLWNRSRWPARSLVSPSIRYYFTHTGTVTPTLSNATGATISGVQTDASGRRYVEITWSGITLNPVNSSNNSRSFTLRLAGTGWDSSDDWSRQGAAFNTLGVLPQMPVYQSGVAVGGATPDMVSTVLFNPPAGSYSSAQNVALSTLTSGASVRYTTDGSIPTSTTGAVYSGPINISTGTIKAIAYKSGQPDSTIGVANYSQVDINAGRQGHYHFDETNGSTAVDSSGSGRNATLGGSASFDPANGKFGGSIKFGTSSSDIASFASASTTQYTVSAWFKANSTGGGTFGRILDAPGYRLYIAPDSSGGGYHIRFQTVRSTTNGSFDTPNNSVTLGTWAHVSASYDGSSLSNQPTIYLNGAPMPLTVFASPAGTQVDNAGTAYWGNSAALTRNWNGWLDEARIYYQRLSTGQQQALYYDNPIQPQTITFNALPTKTYGDASFNPGATASSGLSVSYGSDNTAVATVSGNMVNIVGAGTANITASQAGNAGYSPAANVTQVLSVSKAAPSITTAPTASAITYGQTLAGSSLSGGAGSVAGSFAFTTPSTAPNAGTAAQGVTFTPTDTANYNSVATSVNVTVNKATPSINTAPTASAITYGQTLASSTLSGGSASVAGSFAFSSPTTAPNAGTAAQAVTFSPTDSGNYNNASTTANVTVNKAAASVVLGGLSQTYDGSAKSATSGTSPSGLSVSLTYGGASNAPTNAGSYAVVGTINDANYTGSSSGTLVIAQASQSITFGALPAKTYGDAQFALGATSSSGLRVSYSSDNAAVATVSGSTVTITGAGTANITATQAGDANYLAAANVSQPLTVSAPSSYALTVANGTGSGTYPAGSSVTISANAPATGQIFSAWTGASGFGSATTATTTLTMPSSATTVTATYASTNNDVLAGLAGRWSLDENAGTTAADMSGNGNNGTLLYSPTWTAPGKLGPSALTFSGSNKVSVPHSSSINMTTGMTVAFWMKCTSWGYAWVGQTILQKGNYGWNSLWSIGKPDSNVMRFWIRTVNVNLDAALPAAGQWVHVAATYDAASGVSKLYYNGVLQVTASGTAGTAIGTSTDPAFLGGGEGSGSYVGALDEVRLYNRALSASEVSKVAAWSSVDIATGRQGYYKFDETSGTTTADVSGNNRTATLSGAAAFAPGSGVIGGCINFGSTQPTTATDKAGFTTITSPQFSVAAWMQARTAGANSLGRIVNTPAYAFYIMQDAGSNPTTYHMRFLSTRVTTPGYFDTPVNSVQLNTWTHVAASYDSTSTSNVPTIYLNGVSMPVTVASVPVGAAVDNAGTGYWGNSPAQNRNWNGWMDEGCIYNTTLTPAQVSSIQSVP